MSRNYTEMRRYEQLINQLDAATSRLESRFEEIERRVTKLQVLKSTHGQQRYAGFDSGVTNAAWSSPSPPRRRRTCWDPPLYEQPLCSSFPRGNSSNYETDPYQRPTRLRPSHGQPPGWPPPQHSPPTCWPTQQRRHAYRKQQQTHTYRQQQQPVAAHMEPLNCRFGDSRPVFEQSSYTCTVSDAAPQNFDAEYQVGQSDYLPPHPPYTNSYGQPHNSSARCRLWQPELPLPDRTLHPPMLRPRSAPACTVSANSSAATTQSLSCHKQPTVVLQPLLSSTSLRRSAISSMASAAAPPPHQPQPPLQRSDRPQKQPDTASTIEQPPYAAPRACQPLQSLPVSAPFLASTHHPLAGVSSSRKEEWETHLHDGEEKREDKLTDLNSVWNQQEKVSDSTAKREEEVNKNFPKLIEKETKAEALRASLETKEKDLSVLPEQKSTNEKMEIQCLVEEHKPAFGIQKHDLEVEMEEKRRLFEGDVGVKTTELVTKKSAISQKILKKGGQTYVFDPGGDTSPKCVLSTLFAASWCCGFHLEDKVDFNRGGVDTRHIFFISHYYYLVSL